MNSNPTSGALYPLSDIVDEAEFPLANYISFDEFSYIFNRFYYTDYDAYWDDEQFVTELQIVYAGALGLSLPSLPEFQLRFNSFHPGWTYFHAQLSQGPEPSLTIVDASAQLLVPSRILRDVESSGPGQIAIQTDILLAGAGIDIADPYGVTLKPAYLFDTDLIVEAVGVMPLFSRDDLADDELELSTFQGFEFEKLSITIPLDFLHLADEGSLSFDVSNALFDRNGFSGGMHITATELPEIPLGDYGVFPFEFRELGLDIVHNSIHSFYIAIGMRLLALETDDTPAWMRLYFALDDAQQKVSAVLETPLTFSLGRPDHTLRLTELAMLGVRLTNGFTMEGAVSGEWMLPDGTIYSLGSAHAEFHHAGDTSRFAFAVTDVDLAAFGVVDKATLVVETGSNGADSSQAIQSVYLETEYSWSELSSRLSLANLPEFFPLPPDDGKVSLILDWDAAGELRFKFSTAISDLDSLWTFLPPAYRPPIEQASFTFEATHQEADGTFAGEVDLSLSIRLPQLPAVPGMGLIQIATEDERQLVDLTFSTALSIVHGELASSSLAGHIRSALVLSINLPGLPQQSPPIQLTVREIGLNLTADGTDAPTGGGFLLAGDFALHPVNPADTALPLPPIMASHLERLFRPLTASPIVGSAMLAVEFADDRAAMSLEASFADARIEVDLFDMFASVTRGVPAPQDLDNPANSIDLDIDVGFALQSLDIQIGSLEEMTGTQEEFKFEFIIDLLLMGQQIPIQFALSDQQISFGLTEMVMPLAIPRFPFKRQDMDDTQGGDGLWDYTNIWLNRASPNVDAVEIALLDLSAPLLAQIEEQLNIAHLILTEGEIDALIALINAAKDKSEQEIAALQATDNAEASRLLYLQTRVLPNLNQEGAVFAAKKFMIQSVFAVYNVVATDARPLFQTYFAFYQTIMDNTVGLVYADTDLSLVFEKVRFVLPFHNPSDIRIEGGARLQGFEPDGPLAPLNDINLSVGLSADLIYLAFEGSENPLLLPPYEGRYAGAEVVLDHFRIGYGYSKNSFAISFAGQLALPELLVQDADTSQLIGAGVVLPQQSSLAFKFDLIPIVLGEVDFLLPLFKFDVDLRKDGLPGIADPRTCEPYWDGVQLHIPNILRTSFKRCQFAPFYGPLPAPNYTYDYDIVLGSGETRLAFVCDDLQIITPVLGQYPLPFIADGTPFFENQCLNVRLAGFGVNLNLRRPMPSLSPLAIFEVMGLLSDPTMPIDPAGALAETMYVSLQHAQLSLPPAVVEMFPGLGNYVDREVNVHLNLGTAITITQKLFGYIGDVIAAIDEQVAQPPIAPIIRPRPPFRPRTGRPLTQPRSATTQADFTQMLGRVERVEIPTSAAEIINLLPPELRQLEVQGAFVGFQASAIFLMLTPEELRNEFAKRDAPSFTPAAPSIPANPEELKPFSPAELQAYRPNLPEHFAPLHLPDDPQHNLLQSNVFASFNARDLRAFNELAAQSDAAAVVVGALVNVFDAQQYAFMGYMFADGHFGLVSAVNIRPLNLTVAGLSVSLPLDIQGRLTLNGLARGADSYARVTAQVKADWPLIPGVLHLTIGKQGRRQEAAALLLDSRGHFAAQGMTRLTLFNDAARLNGSVDVSNTHCHVDGDFQFTTSSAVLRHPLLDLRIRARGRVGPDAHFALSGDGSLTIVGNEISDLSGQISAQGAEILGRIDTNKWSLGPLVLNSFKMKFRGLIDLSRQSWPEFLLEGDTEMRLLGGDEPNTGLHITGRGGIESQDSTLRFFAEGRLRWHGHEWLGGRIEFGTRGITVQGRTSFVRPLLKVRNVGTLVISIEIGGHFALSSTGGLQTCYLTGQWMLAAQQVGADGQVIPIAMNRIEVDYSPRRRPRAAASELLSLLSIEKLNLLPVEGITLPVPEVQITAEKSLNIGTTPEDISASVTVPVVDTNASSGGIKVPINLSTSGTRNVDIAQEIADTFFGGVDAVVEVNVPVPDIGFSTRRIKVVEEPITVGGSVEVPYVSVTDSSTDDTVLMIPIEFDIDWDTQTLGTAIDIDLRVALGWQEGRLGILTTHDGNEQFHTL